MTNLMEAIERQLYGAYCSEEKALRALKLAVETLEFIGDGCLVPPDGGQPELNDAVRDAKRAIAAIAKEFGVTP